ncbi:hypothetical protein EV177_003911 [Coemansia sp. RSA 1804]|nr:hypothetical protein EV177_003911 [Coemansia sp. RSA 1804]
MSSIQLFVGRLPRDINSEELEGVFEKYGKLSRCDIKVTEPSYGFVEFEDSDNATIALENCNGMALDGESIVVEIAKKPARKQDDTACFRCGNEGHWARDCPDSRRDDNGGRRRSRSPRRSNPDSRMRGRDNDDFRRPRGDRGDRGDRRDRDNGRGGDRHYRRRGSRSRSRSQNRRGYGGRRGAPRPDRPGNGYRDRSNGRNRSPRRNRNRGGFGASRSPARGHRDNPSKYRNNGSGNSNTFDARSNDSAVGNSPGRMDSGYD